MENGATDSKDPSGFLSEILGAPVTVKLNASVVYKGRFVSCVDGKVEPNPFREQGYCRAWTAI